MQFDSNWTIQQAALEVARAAHEGLGHTKFEEFKITFDQEIQRISPDQEIQLRQVAQLIIHLTDTTSMDSMDIRLATACLLWLAQTRVRDWTSFQLSDWIQER